MRNCVPDPDGDERKDDNALASIDMDMSWEVILLKNVKYVPQLYCNLFSIAAALNEGYKLDGDLKGLQLSKKGRRYVFDRKVRSDRSSLFVMKIIAKKTSTGIYR